MKDSISKGTIYLFVAQFIFLISGYIVHIGLGRMLGPANYGVVGIILSLMLLIQTFLMRGFPQTVSKEIAANPEKKEAFFKKAFQLQILFSAVIAIFFFLGAGVIAWLLHDSSLTAYIRLSSLVIIPTALFSLYCDGYLNGIRKFKLQAILRTVNSVCKPIFIFPLVFLGFAVGGTIWGYIMTGIFSLFLAYYFSKIRTSSTPDHTSLSKLWKQALPVILISVAYVLINNIDLFMLKRMLESNYAAGIFSAADNLARTSPQLFFALSFTIMPAVSAALAQQDVPLAKKYITEALRYLLLILLPITVVVSATATPLVTLFYSSSFADSGPVLQILIFGSMFFAMFTVLNSIAIGAGDSRKALWSSALLIALSIILNWILIQKYGVQGAAMATTATALIGVLMLLAYLNKKFEAGLEWSSTIRIIIASLVIYLLARRMNASGLWIVVEYITLAIIYLLILIFIGEMKDKDRRLIRRILPQFSWYKR